MKKSVSTLLEQGRKIESQFNDFTPQSLEVLNYVHNYKLLTDSEDPQLIKIGQKASQILDVWNLQHFTNFLIPLERYLGLRITDLEICIPTEDKSAANSKQSVLKTSKSINSSLVLICDNIRSAFNVGSMFRTAECFGVDEIWLTGYSPTPENEKVLQTAMSTSEWVSWQYFKSLSDAISEAKKLNKKLLALEMTSQSQNLETCNLCGDLAVIVGNERFGISPNDLQNCDQIIAIPLHGRKNSLNVGISFGIFCYQWRNSQSLYKNAQPSYSNKTKGST